MDWRCATGLYGRTARNLYIDPKIDMTPGRFPVCIRQFVNLSICQLSVCQELVCQELVYQK